MRKILNTSDDQVRLVKSDAIKFLRSLPDLSVDLLVTDPAYSGMNQHLSLGSGRIVGDYSEKGDHDSRWFTEFHDDPENYRIFLKEVHRVLKNDRHIFIMFDSYSLISLAPIVREVFKVKNLVTWDKVNIGMGHYFRRQSEFLVFASKGKRPLSAKNFPDIWKVKRIHKSKYPTQKPVEIFELMIKSSRSNNANPFVVIDPFIGSGSSAIAALRQSCTFIGCDVSDVALNISKSRIQKYIKTGIDELQTGSQIDPTQAHLLGREKSQ